MKDSYISPKDYTKLLHSIIPILLNKGLKATTMDSIATALGMSKRTIYEIFDSKNQMIREVFLEISRIQKAQMERLLKESSGILEVLVNIMKLHRETFKDMNFSFLKDLDSFYASLNDDFRNINEQKEEFLKYLYDEGIRQGVLRPDLNYPMLDHLQFIQLLSLKRAEEFYGKEMSIIEISEFMHIAFLRSIVTPNYLDELDNLLRENGFLNSIYFNNNASSHKNCK